MENRLLPGGNARSRSRGGGDTLPPDTFEEFYRDVTELANATDEVPVLKGFTKSYIDRAGDEGLYVASRKGGKANLVPRTLFMVLWNALSGKEKLTKENLEEDFNLTRVGFLMALVVRLDYIDHDEEAGTICLA